MSDLPDIDRKKLEAALDRNKRSPFGWVMWSANFGVSGILLWGIYTRVVETRFECVIISLALLLYLEMTIWFGSVTLDSAAHRDHRNAIHRHLYQKLGIARDPKEEEEIIELCAKSEMGAQYFKVNRVASSLLWWAALVNLVRAVFFWT
jgi:hypothetical protein